MTTNDIMALVAAVATALTSVLTFATLLFIWRQVRYLRQQVSSSAYMGMVGQMLELDRLYIARPDLTKQCMKAARSFGRG